MNLKNTLISLVIFIICGLSYATQAKTMEKQQITLLEAIDKISKEFEVYFTFDMTLVANLHVEYNQAAYKSAKEAIANILEHTDLKYKFYDQRFVILYKDDAEGLESLKQMSHHLDGLISEGEKLMASAPLRRINTVPRLSSPLLSKIIEPVAFSVEGTVVDQYGEPLIGVNIQVKGSNKGVATDFDGRFSLDNIDENAVLVVSYIGYQTQEIVVAGKSSLVITLIADSELLEEVVVVGYGKIKKANLTGAVDQVGDEALNNRAITSVSQGLQGVLPNLNITFSDGKPTRSPGFNIRGTTSIGQGGSALVLIDGIEGDPSLLNPNDIESVSILKDASSAAIYGARGAFGVVLINTKSPRKDQLSITYSSNYSLNQLSAKNDYVTDSYLWAKMFSEAYSAWNDYAAVVQNVNKSMKFSLEYLDELERRSNNPSLPKTEIDPATGEYIYYHHDTDWYGLLYKDNFVSHDQNLALTGSTEKLNFLITGRYADRPGVFRYNSDDYKSYNFRAKGSIQLTPWLNVQNNTSFSQINYHNPIGANELNIWRGVQYDSPPMAPMFNPDGTLTFASAYSVGGFWHGKSAIDTDRKILSNTMNFTADLFNNKLLVKGDFSYSNTEQNRRTLRLPTPYSKFEGEVEEVGINRNDIQESINKRNYFVFNLYGEHENTIGENYFKILVGGNYELSNRDNIDVYRNGLIWDGAENINLALGQSISTSGAWEEWNIIGGFYRFNYVYGDKYLLEFNGRYDGSSKFPDDQRFAFFPSFSAGWRVSEEKFWNLSNNFISDLKLRASYGSLGNGNINSYTFTESFGVGRLGRILNGVRPQYTNQPAVLPHGLTWETSTTTNIGFDLSLFSQKLNLSGDGYIRKTTDMFTAGVTLPAVFGANSPRGNYADLETKGWELSIAWRNKVDLKSKPVNYRVQLGISDYVSTILKFNNTEKRLNNFYVGQKIGEIWGLVTEGFFESAEEIQNWPDQSRFPSSATGTFFPGDIKFKDLNNDGVINTGDNTVDSPGDRKIIGNSEPRYRFGVNLSANWNNFFVSSFFQGVLKQDWYPDPNSAPFWGQYVAQYAGIPQFHIGNIWSEDNPDAYFPRYTAYIALSQNRSLGAVQTKYLQNAGYVRLKNLQVGYNLPKRILSLIQATDVQFYLTGENIWTYSPFYKLTKGHIDVENIRNADPDIGAGGGGGHAYPILKSFSLGINISF